MENRQSRCQTYWAYTSRYMLVIFSRGMDWRDYAHQVKSAAFAYKPWQLDAEVM